MRRDRAGAAFEAWRVAEAAAGRQWTCPDRAVEGFPFALRLTCRHPTFAGEVAGRPSSGEVESLAAGLSIDRPTSLVVGLNGPLRLRADDDSYVLTVSFETLSLATPLRWPMGGAGAIEAGRLAVTLTTPRQGDVNVRIAHLAGSAAPAAGGEPGDRGFRFAASGASLPTFDAIAGGMDPVDAVGSGVLGRADLLAAPTLRRLEAWRQAGGALRLEALDLHKGAFHGTASGRLALDAAHRPAGRLDATVSGFEIIAQRFGIPIAGAKLGGLLMNLLGGKGADPAAADSDPNAAPVHLPLVLADGRLLVGPIATGVRLDPLY